MAHVASALIEGNPFAQALYRLATQPTLGGFDPDPWEGTGAGQPLIPGYPGQVEHPLCSPIETGWIPCPADQAVEQTTLVLTAGGPMRLALHLAGHGWHVFLLSAENRALLLRGR
jgi:hypothetical protein